MGVRQTVPCAWSAMPATPACAWEQAMLSLLDAGLVSKMVELIARLELRIVFAFQHRVHHDLECASGLAERV